MQCALWCALQHFLFNLIFLMLVRRCIQLHNSVLYKQFFYQISAVGVGWKLIWTSPSITYWNMVAKPSWVIIKLLTWILGNFKNRSPLKSKKKEKKVLGAFYEHADINFWQETYRIWPVSQKWKWINNLKKV